MSMDPIDNSRDENKRVENQRQNRSKETGQKKSGQDFAVRYQAKIKNKENIDAKLSEQEKVQKEGDLFSRVVQVFKGKEESKHQDSHDANKREDLKKEKFKEEGISSSENEEGRFKSVSDDGHARVASKHSSEGDGGSQGQSSGHSGGDEGQSFSGGQSGFSDSGHHDNKSLFKNAGTPTKISGQQFVAALGRSQGNAGGGAGSQQNLTPQIINEIVDHVKVGLNENRETEMEVQLKDNSFSGLKIKATQTSEGVVLTFVCPDRKVRDMFLIHRTSIYQRLKEKEIPVSKIEISLI